MSKVDLYTAVKMQEEEKPGVLSPKEYAGFFSEKNWKKAEDLVSRGLARRLYRVGRWLVGEWEDGTAILSLDREGKPQARSCSCGRMGQECGHSAALALLWSTRRELFSERRVGAKKKYYLWVSPPLQLANVDEAVLTKEQLTEVLAGALNSAFVLQDIRRIAKELGVKLGSRKKVELSKRLAGYLLDWPRVQQSIENLPQEAKVAMASAYLLFTDRRIDIYKRFYESFGFETSWEEAYKQTKRGIWQVYNYAKLPPINILPLSELHLIPVSTVTGVPEGPIVSRTPWDLLKDAYRLISLLDSRKYMLEEIAVPAELSVDYVNDNPFTWHPEWSILPLKAGLLPIYFHARRFSGRVPDVIAGHFADADIALENLLDALEKCGLLYSKDGQVAVLQKNLQEFVKWERSGQVQVLERVFLLPAGRFAAHEVLRKHNYRLAGFFLLNLRYYFGRANVKTFEDNLAWEMFTLLRLFPRGEWISWEEMVRITKVWADPSVAKAAAYGFFTDPWDDWRYFFLDWLQELLRLLAYAGTLDLVERDGKIAFIRVTYLSDVLSMVKGALGTEAVRASSGVEITAGAAGPRETLLYIPLDAPPQVYSLLEKWKAQPELDRGKMRFRLDLRSLGEMFRRGESAESLLDQWEKAVGSPMPSLAERWVRKAYDNYGMVRLYPGVTVVRFRDESARRHMESALTTLRKQVTGELDSKTLVLTSSEAQNLRKDLDKSGYVLRTVVLGEEGKKA